MWAQLISGAAFGALAFVILYANIEVARRLAPRFSASETGDLVEFGNEGTAHRLAGRIGLIVALV